MRESAPWRALARLTVDAATASVALALGPASAGAADQVGQGFYDEYYDFSLDGSTYSVNVVTGNLLAKSIDVPLAGSGSDLAVRRSYNSLEPFASQGPGVEMSNGWRTSLGSALSPSGGTTQQDYTDWTGRPWRFVKQPDGTFRPEDPDFGALRVESATQRAIDEAETGRTLRFSNSGVLASERDETAHEVTYAYRGVSFDDGARMETATSAAGVTRLSYRPDTYVLSSIRGPGGDRTFGYDAAGQLRSVTNPATGAVTTYTYGGTGRLAGVTTPSGTLTVTYVQVEGNYRVHTVALHRVDADLSATLTYSAPDPALCAPGDVRMTVVVDQDGDRSRYCSDASWRLTEFDGTGQDGWVDYDDAWEETGGVDGGPEFGTDEGLSDNPPSPFALPFESAAQDPPHCGRNSYRSGPFTLPWGVPGGFEKVWTFRIKFSRMGITKGGHPFRQYHIHWQVGRAFETNSKRTWLSVQRVLPNGDYDPSPFDDSDTRRARGENWKPWYAHFLRLKVKPYSEIFYHAFTEWASPYVFPDPRGGTIRYIGHRFYGRCLAYLN